MKHVGRIKTEKLNTSSYHVWKQDMKQLLTWEKADEVQEKGNYRLEESKKHVRWNQTGKLAHALISSSLSEEISENVSSCKKVRQTLLNMITIIRCRTLLHFIGARRDFHAVEVKPGKKIPS